MKYSKHIDSLIERFFNVFQSKILQYDEMLYKSHKAYPILTQPMIDRIKNSNHSLELVNEYVPKFNAERTYLQSLVREDLGPNPFEGYRVKKRARTAQSIENILWYMLAILTLGLRIIRWNR